MFLRQVYGTFIGNAQVNGQLPDEEHGKVVVLCEQSHQGSHGDLANKRRLECRCCRDIVCFCKVRAVTEIFDRFNHTDNLASTTDSVFIDFDLSTQQTHQMRRCLAFAMDDFVFFVVLECEVVGEEFPLFVIQGRPYICNQLRNINIRQVYFYHNCCKTVLYSTNVKRKN